MQASNLDIMSPTLDGMDRHYIIIHSIFNQIYKKDFNYKILLVFIIIIIKILDAVLHLRIESSLILSIVGHRGIRHVE